AQGAGSLATAFDGGAPQIDVGPLGAAPTVESPDVAVGSAGSDGDAVSKAFHEGVVVVKDQFGTAGTPGRSSTAGRFAASGSLGSLGVAGQLGDDDVSAAGVKAQLDVVGAAGSAGVADPVDGDAAGSADVAQLDGGSVVAGQMVGDAAGSVGQPDD